MQGHDYRTALPRPNELKVLTVLANAAQRSGVTADHITNKSGVDISHVYTYLARLREAEYVEALGEVRDRAYRVTSRGRSALKLAKKVQEL